MSNRLHHWGGIVAGVLLVAAVFIAPNWISPGLGCFLAFLVMVVVFAWDAYTKPHREFRRHHVASVTAFHEGYWMVCESEAREALRLARKLPSKRTEAILASAVMLGSALMAMRRAAEVCEVLESVSAGMDGADTPQQAMGLAALHKLHCDALIRMERPEEAQAAAGLALQWAERGGDKAALLRHETEATMRGHAGDYKGMLESLRAVEAAMPTVRVERGRRALWSNQAAVYLDTFHPNRALLLLGKALTEEGCTGMDRSQLLTLRGYALDQLGRGGDAAEAHREAVEIQRRYLPPGDERLAYALVMLGQSLALSGNAEAARKALAEAEPFERSMSRGEQRELWHLRGVAALAAGDLENAETALRQTLDRVDTRRIPNHPDQAPILSALASTVERQGRTAEAEEIRERAQFIRECYADIE
ncbi:MAG: tetratricopeptide repeat protein [Bryobacterales bacterium]|nr:tetratricopeptide repeat protein [Bryobacterales bacterium]